MRSIAMRRTKQTTVNGKPLVDIPNKEIEVEYITMSADDRKLYDRVDKIGKEMLAG